MLALCIFLPAIATALVQVNQPQITAGPVPTYAPSLAPRTGWIGVDPVSDVLGPSSKYIAPIGTDSALFTEINSTPQWINIEIHSEYIKIVTETSTSLGIPTTVTKSVQVSTEVVATAIPGVLIGDTAVVLNGGTSKLLAAAAKDAISACSALKVRKRQASGDAFAACLNTFAQTAAGPDSAIFANLEPGALDLFEAQLAPTAKEILKLGVQLLITQAERRKKYLLFLAAVGAGGVAVKMNIPAAGVGGSETETEVGCPLPMQTLNKESPECSDPACTGSGGEKPVCTTGLEKTCPCLQEVGEPHQDFPDMALWNSQQLILASVSAMPMVTPTPVCSVASYTGFDGQPIASPATFCDCVSGVNFRVQYATDPAPSSPCAFAAWPTSKLAVSMLPKTVTGNPTSCRLVTDTFTSPMPAVGTFTSCTCNDNGGHALRTTTIGGTSTVVCPDYTGPPSTPSATPLPTSIPNMNCDGALGTTGGLCGCYPETIFGSWPYPAAREDTDNLCVAQDGMELDTNSNFVGMPIIYHLSIPYGFYASIRSFGTSLPGNKVNKTTCINAFDSLLSECQPYTGIAKTGGVYVVGNAFGGQAFIIYPTLQNIKPGK